jgi:hypothetical protein
MDSKCAGFIEAGNLQDVINEDNRLPLEKRKRYLSARC